MGDVYCSPKFKCGEDLDKALLAALDAEENARKAEAAAIVAQTASNGPIIRDGTWWTWNADSAKYVNTGVLAQGATGPQGAKGDKGDTGATGSSFRVLDYYASLSALQSAVPYPAVGDAYGIGTGEPYDIYIYGETSGWVNNGPVQGVKGEQGERGEAFTYEDFTAEQLAALKGDKGDTGSPGAPGSNATINGVTALTISGNNGVSASQSGGTLNLSVSGTLGGQVVANSSAQTPGTSLLRNSKLVSSDTTPAVNGEIYWTYE